MKLSDFNATGHEIELSPVTEREGSIQTYRRILVAVIREIQRETRDTVLPEYRRALTLDDGEETWFDRLKALAEAAVFVAIGKVRRLFREESASHAVRLAQSVKRGIGIDVHPLLALTEAEEERLVELYVQRNASLIKSLSDDTVKRVEQAVYDARLNRQTWLDLRKTLAEQFGIAQRRAELIAYDQLASLNSDFTRSRHNALGIDDYSWRSRRDGRERPLHRRLDGQRFKWSERGPAENGQHAGKPVRCRCTAVGIIAANPASAEADRRRREELAASNAEARRRARRRVVNP